MPIVRTGQLVSSRTINAFSQRSPALVPLSCEDIGGSDAFVTKELRPELLEAP
jgi:hypothetical protein